MISKPVLRSILILVCLIWTIFYYNHLLSSVNQEVKNQTLQIKNSFLPEKVAKEKKLEHFYQESEYFTLISMGLLILCTTFTISNIRETKRKERFLVNQRQEKEKLALDLKNKYEQRTRDLKEATSSVIKANELKSSFLANMSHEIRTPLHGIISYAKFGKKDAAKNGDEQYQNDFGEILSSAEKLLELLNDLLDLSKLEAGKTVYKKKQQKLFDVLNESILEFRGMAQEKEIEIKLENENLSEFIFVYIDQTKILQVLRNLISNAIKFSTPNTEIILTPNISPKSIILDITNTGVPIPEEELSTIFEKFSQSSKTMTKSGGTGLGLSICKQIILDHGGDIHAKSSEEGKTTFTFSIPVLQNKLKLVLNMSQKIPKLSETFTQIANVEKVKEVLERSSNSTILLNIKESDFKMKEFEILLAKYPSLEIKIISNAPVSFDHQRVKVFNGLTQQTIKV